MNISCLQENLSAALSIVRSGIGKESGLQILSTILLRAEGKLIYLNATNLEIAVQCSMRGKVEEEGSVALPAKTFLDFVSLLPKEKIELKTGNDSAVTLTCGSYRTKINGFASDEFPLIQTPENGVVIRCAQGVLKRAFSSAGHAAAAHETRLELHGVFLSWDASQKTAVCVGTDAYRLSEKTFAAHSSQNTNLSCIIPLRTVQELSRSILSDDEQECEVVITETQVCFRTETVECISKVVQGTFPDYRSIIPQNFHTRAVVNCDELVRAVKATSLFSRGGLNDVVCRLESTDGMHGLLTLSSANAAIGENTVSLDAEMTGGENSTTINYRYLLDGLSHVESDTVSLSVVDTQSPCVIRPVGKDDFIYLIMPIRE